MKTPPLSRLKQLRRAAKIGGLRRSVIHGNPGTIAGRRKGGLNSARQHRITGKGITVPKIIHIPSDSCDLAEFVGIIAGDGHLSKYQVSVSTNSITDIQHAHFIADLGKKLFRVTPKITVLKTRRVVTIVFSSRNMVQFLESKGLIQGNKVHQCMRIAPWIMENSMYQVAFLRGVFDTDGGIFLDRHRIKHKLYAHLGWQFTSAIPDFLSDVASILDRNGYRFSHSKTRVNILMRRALDIERYFREIGTHNTKHFNRFIGLK